MSVEPPPFSRPVAVERLPAGGRTVKLAAESAERAALAALFDLASLETLEATVSLRPFAGGDMLRLAGTLSARLEQRCVVSLVPVPAEVSASFERTFAFSGGWQDDGSDLDLEPDGEDPPDPVIDGKVDVGAVVAEELALALDPYPRAPDAAFAAPDDDGGDGDAVAENPFAVLAALRDRRDG